MVVWTTTSILNAETPQLIGDWWVVAGNPDLQHLGSEKQQPVDFGIWQAADGTWQLWSCIRHTQEPGKTRLFYRWESDSRDITQPNWQPRGIAMRADPQVGETAGGLQAPHVVREGDTWHMFYGDWQHICHATSQDGKNFQRVLQGDHDTHFVCELPVAAPEIVLDDDQYYLAALNPQLDGIRLIRLTWNP